MGAKRATKLPEKLMQTETKNFSIPKIQDLMLRTNAWKESHNKVRILEGMRICIHSVNDKVSVRPWLVFEAT